MSGYELAFLAMTIVGVGFLILSLLVGELSDVFGDISSESGGYHHDGPGFLSPSVLSGGLAGYGVTGFIAVRSGLSGVWAVLLGAVVGVAVAGLIVMLLSQLSKQQANSHISDRSFVDLPAVVTVSIPPAGKGEVQFRDPNGGVVRRPAMSTWSQVMPTGTDVVIKRVLADHVLVSRN
ncbi:MAG TPA: hypothetical protein PK691_04970 [Thermomicrobiales bacterium]|nr:hypothetical protein [Thermomicrobiales bacterium]